MHYYADDRWKITSPSVTPTLITPPLSFLIVLLREDTENIYNLRHTLYIGYVIRNLSYIQAILACARTRACLPFREYVASLVCKTYIYKDVFLFLSRLFLLL